MTIYLSGFCSSIDLLGVLRKADPSLKVDMLTMNDVIAKPLHMHNVFTWYLLRIDIVVSLERTPF